MLNIKQSTTYATLVALAALAAATTAMGESGPAGSVNTTPAPVSTASPTQPSNEKEQVRGFSRFEGSFSDKSGTSGLECRARMRFEMRDLLESESRNERDRLEIEC